VSGGAQPYLIQWEEPQAAFGLEDYGERLMRACIDAIDAETGEERLFLVGHSLGGVLAAIFASLHPSRLQGLVLMASPLHFDFAREAGALGPVIATLSRSGLIEAMPGNLPGSCLNLVGFLASPATFGRDRWVDWLRSLPDDEAVKTHLRVERWSLDELPLARQLVVDSEEQLYREDAFLRGKLALGSQTASAREVVMPLLVVADPRCLIIPPQAVLPFVEAAGATDKRLLWYEGDVGVAIQHLGMLIGRNAHRQLWPEILHWVHAHRRPSSF
jgi:polyhydroxyalkanoate synthase